MVDYIEKLVIENIRNIKFAEKENIPEDLKSYRLKYLQEQQELLLDQLSNLKSETENGEIKNGGKQTGIDYS